MGGLFSLTTLASSLVILPTDTTLAVDSSTLMPSVQMETVKSFNNILPGYTGVSQGYHWGHPGIDLTAPLGTKIYPLKPGRVSKILNLRWDYGRAVIVDHANGLVTLYAHMGKLYVQEGEEVTMEKPLGEVGLTGKTTGPHLHFEIVKNGGQLNPLPLLALGSPTAR